MTARYKGVIVRVVRIAGRHSIIIWRNMQKRVNSADLELVKDSALILTFVLSLGACLYLALR